VAVKKKIDRLGATAHPQRGWRKAVALVGLLACVAVGKALKDPPRVLFLGEGRWWRLGRKEAEKGHGHGQW